MKPLHDPKEGGKKEKEKKRKFLSSKIIKTYILNFLIDLALYRSIGK